MKKLVLLFSIFVSFNGFSQFGPMNIIDNSAGALGTKRIIAADLNNDNLNEIIVAQAYNVNQLAYYPNPGNGTFGTKVVIDATSSYPVSVVAGDLNGDNFTDLVTVAQTYGEVFVYLNDGNFNFTRQEVDSGTLLLNGLVMEDFDHNGTKDLVVIGQHSIDLYRNNGSAVFTKEHILTTSTSPNILECMYIETADMNNDGHPDVLTGETIGAVIYYNDGTGTFSPQKINTQPFICRLAHAVDIDNDGLKDVVYHATTAEIKWYRNHGAETYHAKGAIATNIGNILTSMESVDADDNGYQDLYYAYGGKACMLFNNGDDTFGPETYLYQDINAFINEVTIANLDLASNPEFIWSGVGGMSAYHKSTVLNVSELNTQDLQIYPNPSSEIITIEASGEIREIRLFNSQGQEIAGQNGTSSLDLSKLAAGTYVLEVIGDHFTAKRRISKQ